MIIKEYRFAMPMTLKEFEKGQRYSVAKASLNETGGGQGIEILKCVPFESDTLRPGEISKGTYTHKIYHLKKKAPRVVRLLLPDDVMDLEEKSWNAFPYTKTIIRNPGYMKEDFFVIIETLHTADDSIDENALGLSEGSLKEREVVCLDIANEACLDKEDIKPATNPLLYHSEKTGRGPLDANWSKTAEPRMNVYKVCTVYFKWWGLQNIVENFFHKNYPRLFTKFHREMFCWIDEWFDLTAQELVEYEADAAEKLKRQLNNGEVIGMNASESSRE